MFTRLNAIGTATRICIHDAFSDVITVPYCGLQAESGQTALLSVYQGAMGVEEIARRFGLTLTSDQIPAIFFLKYLTDNTSLRTKDAIAIIKRLRSTLELIEKNRPERKGGVEAGHHSTNSSLDDKIDGSNYGRQRARGEEAAAITACWTWFEYYAELLLAIAYHNTCADASALFDAHPCRTEMLRDGVAKTRIAIFKWALRSNRNSSPTFDRNLLRARLLPPHRCVVRPNGIFLLRNDRGNKLEYVKGPRFIGPRVTHLQMMERARRGERIELDVHLDPYDISRGWFSDERGIHELVNIGADPILRREGTLPDCYAHQDDEHINKLLDQSEDEQNRSDYVSHVADKNAKNRKAKEGEISAASKAGTKVTKKRLKTGVAANRAAEAAAIESQFDPLNPSAQPTSAGSNASQVDPNCKPPDTNTPNPATATPPHEDSDIDEALGKFRRNKRSAQSSRQEAA
jgi:hypothetical protein